MGFLFPSDIVENLSSNCENMEQNVKIHDQYVRRQMLSTHSQETQRYLLPIWKLRSSFNDALRHVEDTTIRTLLSSDKVFDAVRAIKEGKMEVRSLLYLMVETCKCYATYQAYIKRLKELRTRTKYIFKTISHRKLDELDEYAETRQHDPVAIRHHYNRIVYVLEMSIVIAESIQDALQNAQSVIECARTNLEIMKSYYETLSMAEEGKAGVAECEEDALTSSSAGGSTTATTRGTQIHPKF